MAWCVMRSCDEIAEANHLVGFIEMIDWWGLIDLEAKQSSVLDGLVVQKQIVAMKRHRNVQRAFRGAHAGDVVDVRMGQQDVRQRDPFARREHEQTIDLVAWIDQHALPCS